MQHLHDHAVRHSDLNGKNILLDSNRNVRLCDFGGSAIDDKKSVVTAGSGFKHPIDEENSKASIKAELHALGSSIYEIITSTTPHQDVKEEWVVAQMIRDGNYPDLTGITLSDIISKCWKGEFASALDVAKEIEEIERRAEQ